MINENNNIMNNDHLFYQSRIFKNTFLQLLGKIIKSISTCTLRICDNRFLTKTLKLMH